MLCRTSLLWLAEALLRFYPDPFAPEVPHAGTLCFTPYFHVMGFVANTVFNLHAGCRTFILASHAAALSPRLMLSAAAALRPSVINTVPWIVEGVTALVASDETFGARPGLTQCPHSRLYCALFSTVDPH